MSIDRMIKESLSDKAGEFEIREYKYEEMLEYIERKAEQKNNKIGFKLLKSIRNFVAAFHSKDFVEVAAFILVLIAVPVMASHRNNIPEKSTPDKVASEITNSSTNTTGSIDPKTVNLDQAVKDGNIVMLTDLDAGGANKVYNIEKLDKFMENYKNGKRDNIRIVKFALNKSDFLVNSIIDLNYDGSRIESIGYDLYSDKTTYKATAPYYFAKIARTESKDGIRYSLCEKADDPDNMGMTLISFSKANDNNTF